MIDLKSLSPQELTDLFSSIGEREFRARQLIHWIYQKNASSIDEITEFSRPLRERLSKIAYLSHPKILKIQQSKDHSEKFLLLLKGDDCVEAVYMPEDKRATLCVSTQVGCAMGCRFCRTGTLGLKRNLTATEVVDQVLAVKKTGRPVTNLVFMGMGEPLANLREVLEALWRLTDLVGISPRRITVSTVGLIKALEEFSRVAPAVNLAVSLNATLEAQRTELMPISKTNPLNTLLDTLREYPIKRGRRITFEYVLLRGINDSLQDARRLVKLLRGIPCKVNLIPFNPFEGSVYEAPDEGQILRFQEVLINGQLSAFIRKSRGQDIDAACGQLWGATLLGDD